MIKAIALDVDGVLTDGTFWWGPRGEECKRFSFRDVMGVSRGLKAGLCFALISGEESPQVDRFAQKLGINDVWKGCKDKAAAVREFAQRRGFELSEICFVGDDINDLPAMEIAGRSAAPSDAYVRVRERADYVSSCPAGLGAVREVVDLILAQRAPLSAAQQRPE